MNKIRLTVDIDTRGVGKTREYREQTATRHVTIVKLLQNAPTTHDFSISSFWAN